MVDVASFIFGDKSMRFVKRRSLGESLKHFHCFRVFTNSECLVNLHFQNMKISLAVVVTNTDLFVS